MSGTSEVSRPTERLLRSYLLRLLHRVSLFQTACGATLASLVFFNSLFPVKRIHFSIEFVSIFTTKESESERTRIHVLITHVSSGRVAVEKPGREGEIVRE